MEGDKISVGEFSRIVDKVVELLGIKETLRRIEAKVDAKNGLTPEQQALIDKAKALLDANDAAVERELKSKS